MPQSTILNNTRSGQPVSSNEINDLITIPPNWLLRSGITMVAIVSITIITMSYFIKYPDKVTSTAILTSAHPPIEIVSRSEGYIENIVTPEAAFVEKGKVLVHINNTTNLDDLQLLKVWIEGYQKVDYPKKYLLLSYPQELELGSIQSGSGRLELNFKELCQVLENPIVFEQIENMSDEISTIRRLNESLMRKNQIFSKQTALTKKRYERQAKLYQEGVISEVDLEVEKSNVLQQEKQSEEITNNILQNKIRIKQLALEKLKLKDQRLKAIEDLQFTMDQEILEIENSIQNWSRSYNIESPISGKISYITGLSSKKSIRAGQVIGHILPEGNTNRYLSATYPVTNIGKIKASQRVLIKFDAYPYKEFGMVEAEVASISEIPELNKKSIPGYEVIVPLSDTIVTDAGNRIPYMPNMTAIVEIITEDRTIFDRIFDQFLGLIKEL